MYGQQHPEFILRLLGLAEAPDVEVVFYEAIRRAIVVVLAGANVAAPRPEHIRTASRESGWDVEVTTTEELAQRKQLALRRFAELEGVAPAMAQALIDLGYFTYDDLAVIDPQTLMQLGALDPAVADRVLEQCEARSLESEGGA